jgi:hypothetical protein
MVYHAWNQSWEITRGVTHPGFRGAGLATALAQHCIADACASPLGDIVFGYPRIYTMQRILSEAVKPGMFPTGHDGAINIANGVREYHLFSMFPKPGALFRHVIPEHRSLPDSSFVIENVFAPLQLTPEPGRYPEEIICGQSVSHPDLKPLSFGYDPFCPSDSLEVTAYTGDSRDPATIAFEIDACVKSFNYAKHVRMAVLIDKTDVIRALRTLGFAVTAYLPAWRVVNGDRYDCALMVRSKFDVEPSDYGLRPWIDRFGQGLQS